MRDGNEDVYLIAPDGSDPVNWTHQPTAESGASISPDGLAIAFTSDATGDPEIWAAYVDGTGLIQLTDASGFDGTPSWSPDGSKIAFVSERDGNEEIYVMNANGSGQVNVSNRPFSDDRAPHWSPDGQWIAFTSDRTGTWQLFTMASDGSSQAQLTHNYVGAANPAWSPLGNEIAYHALGDSTCVCAHIRVIKANGADPTRITYPPGSSFDWSPAWSRDGMRIAFTSDRTGDDEVWVMNADGSDPVNVTNHPGADDALWTAQAWSR